MHFWIVSMFEISYNPELREDAYLHIALIIDQS